MQAYRDRRSADAAIFYFCMVGGNKNINLIGQNLIEFTKSRRNSKPDRKNAGEFGVRAHRFPEELFSHFG